MTDVEHSDQLDEATARALAGGPERHRTKAAEQGKLPVRERVAQLLDPGSFAEEGLLASWESDGLGAEGEAAVSGHAAPREAASRHPAVPQRRPDTRRRRAAPPDVPARRPAP